MRNEKIINERSIDTIGQAIKAEHQNAKEGVRYNKHSDQNHGYRVFNIGRKKKKDGHAFLEQPIIDIRMFLEILLALQYL